MYTYGVSSRRHPSLFRSPDETRLAEAISALTHCNPFLPERIEWERRLLGPAFIGRDAEWNLRGERLDVFPNRDPLLKRVGSFVETMRARLDEGARAGADERSLYEDAVLFHLFHAFTDELAALADEEETSGRTRSLRALFTRFDGEARRFLCAGGNQTPAGAEVPHLFACFFQLRRAFVHIFRSIIGASRPAARFRAEVWQSVFTHDMRRYRRTLFARMGDVSTLITGPSGTGKELAARAIGLSRYIPFDVEGARFAHDFREVYFAVNLSALSPTLIESELFGHRRGAFTGAIEDRAGWFERCPGCGTIFLDEVGDLDPAIQVKLLRVLQGRVFQRVGETEARRFAGKIVAATNRDMGAAQDEGRFRSDLYYRLCSDIIEAPSLRAQLDDSPEELARLVGFLAHELAGDEGASLGEEVVRCVEESVGMDYAWPGNVRELEQCVRNVMVRGAYRAPAEPSATEMERLTSAVGECTLSADELMRRYCSAMYAREGSYEAAARRLGLDRRTVRARVDGGLVAAFRGRIATPER